MAARFVFTEEAELQLFKILDYLADESESAAVAFALRFTMLSNGSPRDRASDTRAKT